MIACMICFGGCTKPALPSQGGAFVAADDVADGPTHPDGDATDVAPTDLQSPTQDVPELEDAALDSADVIGLQDAKCMIAVYDGWGPGAQQDSEAEFDGNCVLAADPMNLLAGIGFSGASVAYASIQATECKDLTKIEGTWKAYMGVLKDTFESDLKSSSVAYLATLKISSLPCSVTALQLEVTDVAWPPRPVQGASAWGDRLMFWNSSALAFPGKMTNTCMLQMFDSTCYSLNPLLSSTGVGMQPSTNCVHFYPVVGPPGEVVTYVRDGTDATACALSP